MSKLLKQLLRTAISSAATVIARALLVLARHKCPLQLRNQPYLQGDQIATNDRNNTNTQR